MFWSYWSRQLILDGDIFIFNPLWGVRKVSSKNQDRDAVVPVAMRFIVKEILDWARPEITYVCHANLWYDQVWRRVPQVKRIYHPANPKSPYGWAIKLPHSITLKT